ncbi:MAG: FhaA domain-containing protein [Chloroflexota bacterium]
MRPFANIERFFERLFERPSARIFRTRLQPVQLQRRIERAMEAERLSASDRTLVPNRYVVHLHPDDLATFGDLSGTLAVQLADGALAFARAHRYTLVDRPRVDLLADAAVERADIQVDARFADPLASRAAGGGVALAAAGAGATGGNGGMPEPGELGTSTMVFAVPRPPEPRAILRVTTTGGGQRRVAVEGPMLSIGRATDNDLVLVDGRVSRHHGRIQARRGTLVYTDLRSTNGSRVNGEPVVEVVLGAGDRIEIGDTTLVLEALDGVASHPTA